MAAERAGVTFCERLCLSRSPGYLDKEMLEFPHPRSQESRLKNGMMAGRLSVMMAG
jgi:hypothetical protein